MNEIQLIDYAENLVVLDRNTIEKLYQLDNCDECVTLYLLYYKLAKWQKTDTVKANDEYIRKCLKWGRNKIIRAKQTLKTSGLIEIVQKRKNNKINGWYIKVHYVVSNQKLSSIQVKQEVSFQDVSNGTCTEQTTIALRENINCLKNKIKLLKEENNKLNSLLKESQNGEKSDLEKMDTYKEIVKYMNTVNEHPKFNTKIPFSYKSNSKATQKLINARLREGYNVEEFKDVIWWGYRKFVEFEFKTQNGESSYKYFRPSTIFSQEHFEEYLNEYRANTI